MSKFYGFAFHLFCVLVSLPRFIDSVPTSLPEVPTTPPYPPAPPAETADVRGDPPIAVPETPFTLDHPVLPLTTVKPVEEDGTPIPIDECKDPKPYDSPCASCWCEFGEWVCAIMDCAPPQCQDAYTEPGQCCPTCPNGSNCDADGEIIPSGTQAFIKSGAECYCELGTLYCIPPEPTPPSCDDSTTIEITCGYCFCDKNSGGWGCLDRPCNPPMCVDVVKSQDGCCDECPNGYNCEAYGEIIPWGEVKTLFNGLECACEFSWDWSSSSPLKAQCNHLPQPPAPITELIADNSSDLPPESPPEEIPENDPESPPVSGQ